MTLNRQVKDTLLRALLQSKKVKIELYNALNGSNYTEDVELIDITLEDVIYLQVKNDVSFLIGNTLNIYEHQSTYNPNMPLRTLFYYVRQLEQLVDKAKLYGSKLVEIPTPKFVELYNGTRKRPEVSTIKLSEAYIEKGVDGENIGDIELTVTVYNINKGFNKNLMELSPTLEGYSYLIDRVRQNEKSGLDKVEAIKEAINNSIEQNKLKDFLKMKGSEAMGFILSEYDAKAVEEVFRTEAYEDGYEVGIEKGMEKGIEKGVEKGLVQGEIKTLHARLKWTDEQIAKELALELQFVQEIIKELNL
ncbi:MAG: hypothetical protein ATN35_03820 [Epulopiscium sp. Nele67-Bin004]|nr:MAG: hypothetical protein ATN35_03820 [Epulopiscium sp. Nele67-Bin004]